MKCPNCGQKIAKDSVFCEFCGSAIQSIGEDGQTVSNNDGVLKTFLFLFIASTIILSILVVSKSNELTSVEESLRRKEQVEIESKEWKSKYSQLESESKEKLSKLGQIESTSNTHPLIITDVKIGNYYKNGDVETSFGNTIYSSSTMYLKPQISYVGIVSGSYYLDVKLYDSNGNLFQGSSSPANMTYNSSIYIYEGRNKTALTGWGNSTKGHWSRGEYKLEIWYSSYILFSKEFSIY